ncbi:hypothetical protein QVD17_37344 [Tagetes erecta]|uniref:Wall-associated receptor kinase galacturonan-binding domain-containing protein n=1 Tax=Tagetes erecta TaxID=13708 RepID=A0AAD8JWA9_TARER|nr:hypothetical protein QVD17_37344 [Tagetes erecta]
MKMFQAYQLLIFVSLTSTSIAQNYTKFGCNDTCGNNVRIPYPFGIGSDCSINEWYNVECTSSKPYLSALNYEVLGVNLEEQIVTVNTPTIISGCQNPVQKNNNRTMSMDLGDSPFLFSKSHNKFVFEGCGNAFIIEDGSVVTGCSTSCLNETVSERNDKSCYGISCCQATIPYYLKSYSMNLTRLGDGGGCGYAFLVNEDSFVNRSFFVAANNASVPVSLMWTLTSSDTRYCCEVGAFQPRIVELKMGNDTLVKSQKCSLYTNYEGNPYLYNGCKEIEECARCPYGTYCDYDIIYDGDGLISGINNFTCPPSGSNYINYGSKSSSMGVILGEKPISLTRFGEYRSLVTHFMLAMEEGHVISIFDAIVIKEGARDELLALANLAMRCLNFNGKFRPTMKEVAIELESIRTTHIPSTTKTNIGPVMHGEEVLTLPYDESSTFFSINSRSSN